MGGSGEGRGGEGGRIERARELSMFQCQDMPIWGWHERHKCRVTRPPRAARS